jgi:chloramphenicol 3-O phosphotransferase
VPPTVLKFQEEVHKPGIYDLEVDTTNATPEECVAQIRRKLEEGTAAPSAFERLAARVAMP